MNKLTIKEIARMAGVSPTAVSFVLNNREGVSEETRKKVNEVILKTDYKPSINSRRLSLKRSFNISIVIKQTSSPFNDLFYFEIARGVLEKSKEYGYNIVFTDILQQNGAVILPEIILYHDTDGIIFFQDTDMAVLKEIDKLQIPYVVVDAHTAANNFTCVNADYELSSYTATRLLIDNGHRDIAFLGSSAIPEFCIQAFSGFKRALEESRIAVPSSWIQTDIITEASAYSSVERLLQNPPIPSAFFCLKDIFAIEGIKCARNNGFRIPEDTSFVGIDDILLAQYIEPPLSTIKIDKITMGILAMELIVKKINGEKVDSITVASDNVVLRNSIYQMRPVAEG